MATETEPFEILLAEDSEGDAELVRKAFKQRPVDCSIHIVSDGARTIGFLNRIERGPNPRSLNLSLLDLRLPICEEHKITASLRSTKYYGHTPAVVMTGLSSSAVRERASRHQAMPLFEKPSTLEVLQPGSMIRQGFKQRMVKPDHQIAQGGAV